MKCVLGDGCGWVCENHPDKPWEGEHACPCGGAGMPCRNCNMSGDDETRGYWKASGRMRARTAGVIDA